MSSQTTLLLSRRLSIEETYNLAATARRKSSSQASRNDLRMKLGHTHMLEALEQVIRTSPPPSPKQSSLTPVSMRSSSSLSLPPSASISIPKFSGVDEYGFAYEDGEEDPDNSFGEDFGLELTRTESRRN